VNISYPTPDLELNSILREFTTNIQSILSENFIAVYLQGSFAVGDWDCDSDVDFLVVIHHELSEVELASLQTMHGKIYDLKSPWAQHLEGSYFPQMLLKQYDPLHTPIYFLDNTNRELALSDHDNTSVVRWVVREYGIPMAGPDPKTLIDPVSSNDLRQEILTKMDSWAQEVFSGADPLSSRWRQPYAVISYCRMLHTLNTGRVASKLAGVEWAKHVLDSQWSDLIQRAWDDRPDVGLKARTKADPADIASTIDFIRYALVESRRFRTSEF